MELTIPSAEHETVKQFLVLIVDAIALARDLHLQRQLYHLHTCRPCPRV